MHLAEVEQTVRILAELRVRPEFRLAGLPPNLKPADMDQAYVIQEALHRHFEVTGYGKVVGWKLATTTKVMQERLGINHPCPGAIYDCNLFRRHGNLPGNMVLRAYGAECEIGVRLAKDLPAAGAPYDLALVADAVDAVFTCMELGNQRYAHNEETRLNDAPTVTADDAWGWGCVVADPVTNWRGIDFAVLKGTTTMNGEIVASAAGDLPLGHPFAAVAWLANFRAKHGLGLKAGEFVSTGSIIKPAILTRIGDTASCEIERLGRVTARVVD